MFGLIGWRPAAASILIVTAVVAALPIQSGKTVTAEIRRAQASRVRREFIYVRFWWIAPRAFQETSGPTVFPPSLRERSGCQENSRLVAGRRTSIKLNEEQKIW